LHGITLALASVGRAFVCLDPSFRIVHVSKLLNDFLGQGVATELRGRPVEELLGEDLFGPGGQLRQALLEGQMREGWRGTLKFANSCVHHDSSAGCGSLRNLRPDGALPDPAATR
jgi:hypothetical protein